MKTHSSRNVIVYSTIAFFVLGLLYCVFAPKVYSSKSHVALFRLKIEVPDSSLEDSHNRWIWIRDGLSLKSALFTEAILNSLSNKSELIKKEISRFPNKRLAYDYFNGLINIQFTGADENNYLVEVKAKNPQIAYELNRAVFDRLKFLAVNADQNRFDDLIKKLRSKQTELKKDREAYTYYDDKIKKLSFANIVEQKQKEMAFEVISSPTLNEVPIWPRMNIILLAAAFFGLVFGLAIDFVLTNLNLNLK